MKERKAADERSGHPGAASLPQSPLYKLYPAAFAHTDFWDDLNSRLSRLCLEYSYAGQPKKDESEDLFRHMSIIWGIDAVLKDFQHFYPRETVARVAKGAPSGSLQVFRGRKTRRSLSAMSSSPIRPTPHGRFAGPKRHMTEATLRRYLDNALKEATAEPSYDGWLDKTRKKKKKKS